MAYAWYLYINHHADLYVLKFYCQILNCFKNEKPRNLLQGLCYIEFVLLNLSYRITCPAFDIPYYKGDNIDQICMYVYAFHFVCAFVLTMQRWGYFFDKNKL